LTEERDQVSNVIHHTAICVADIDTSLRFYRDGLGMEITTQGEFAGPWQDLFGGPDDVLNMVMLGDPANSSAGVIELISFPSELEAAAAGPASNGVFLVSMYVDVDATLARLADLGYAEHKRIDLDSPHGSITMATVRDPDGVLIELVDAAMGAQVTG
jgi:glyoxylase I family protein